MANIDRPNGLAPWGKVRRVNEYVAAGAIGRGDAVVLDSNGRVAVPSSGGSAYAGALVGVAIGAAEAADDKILVADDPHQEYKVQASGSDIGAQTEMNLNYSLKCSDRDSATKESRQELKSDTGAATATLPLKVLRLDRDTRNALGDKAKVVVIINNHQLGGGTGTAGV